MNLRPLRPERSALAKLSYIPAGKAADAIKNQSLVNVGSQDQLPKRTAVAVTTSRATQKPIMTRSASVLMVPQLEIAREPGNLTLVD